ncbi:MAG: hypothetical protein Q7U38_10755 [Methylobacter sp.]|nr:hypothetical protein [Methylobacter sp.]MDP2098064.1 hypothetical protein [Methylobacter sp.]MDP3055878.1 hypothetical protein [Methylobacter sp.]MDZ4218023.1 hypothetical protein [Methylobacter sp.]
MGINLIVDRKRKVEDFEVRLKAIGGGVMIAAQSGQQEMLPGIERALIQLQKDVLALAKSGGAQDPPVVEFATRLVKLDEIFNKLKKEAKRF